MVCASAAARSTTRLLLLLLILLPLPPPRTRERESTKATWGCPSYWCVDVRVRYGCAAPDVPACLPACLPTCERSYVCVRVRVTTTSNTTYRLRVRASHHYHHHHHYCHASSSRYWRARARSSATDRRTTDVRAVHTHTCLKCAHARRPRRASWRYRLLWWACPYSHPPFHQLNGVAQL